MSGAIIYTNQLVRALKRTIFALYVHVSLQRSNQVMKFYQILVKLKRNGPPPLLTPPLAVVSAPPSICSWGSCHTYPSLIPSLYSWRMELYNVDRRWHICFEIRNLRKNIFYLRLLADSLFQATFPWTG